jgi:hypothetical protein
MYGQGRWGIRVNQNTDLFNVTYKDRLHSVEERQVRFGRFSVGLNYTPNKVTHELELFVPEINASADPYAMRSCGMYIPINGSKLLLDLQ